MIFKNDENSEMCLEWWSNQCIDWCYDKIEDNKLSFSNYVFDAKMPTNNSFVWQVSGNSIICNWEYCQKNCLKTLNNEDPVLCICNGKSVGFGEKIIGLWVIVLPHNPMIQNVRILHTLVALKWPDRPIYQYIRRQWSIPLHFNIFS